MSRIGCNHKLCIKKSCHDKKNCACRCGDLATWNYNLLEGCVNSCQSNSSWQNVPSGKKWAIRELGAEYLWDNFKIQVDGFDPLTDSNEGVLFTETQKKNDESDNFQRGIIVVLGTVLLGLIINFVFSIGEDEKPVLEKQN